MFTINIQAFVNKQLKFGMKKIGNYFCPYTTNGTSGRLITN